MKRKLGLFLAGMLMATSLVGCTSEQTSYMQETKKMSSWESIDSDIKGTVKVKFPVVEPVAEGQTTPAPVKYDTLNVNFDGKGYTLDGSGKNPKAYVTLNLKSDKKDVLDIKDVKIYVDSEKVYISKNYFEGIIKSTGQELPKVLKDVKQEYILIDGAMGQTGTATPAEYQAMEDYIKAMSSPEKKDEMMNKLTKVMEKINFDIPVTKTDRTYTVTLTSDQLLDKALKSMDSIIANSEEIIKMLELQDQLKLTKEDFAELKKSYNEKGKAEMTTDIATAKEMLKGSTITTKETFGDDTHVVDMNFKFVVKDMMDMDMTMNQTSKKSEKRDIVMPKVENSISMDKYMEKMMPVEETTPAPAQTATTPAKKAA